MQKMEKVKGAVGPLGAIWKPIWRPIWGEIMDFWRILDPQTDPKTSNAENGES